MSSEKKEIRPIGIILGGGSGKILAEVFINFLIKIGEKYGIGFEFYVNSTEAINIARNRDFKPEEEFEYTFNIDELEYTPFSTHIHKTHKSLKQEVKEIKELLDKWHNSGIKYIFRTSINADILYKLRSDLWAVKLIETDFNSNKVLILRDEAQGFYFNDSCEITEDKKRIIFESHFDKIKFEKLLEQAKNLAREIFVKKEFKFLVIYKHHLFNGYIEDWVKEIEEKLNLEENKISLCQPDTGASEFLNTITTKSNENIVMLVGNEVGDILDEYLLQIEGRLKYKIAMFSRNFYLELPNLVVFQTVHGSVDDKCRNKKNEVCDGTEKDCKCKVLPLATIRIAAYILSEIIWKTDIFDQVNTLSKREIIENLMKNTNLEKINDYNPFQKTNNLLSKLKI